MPSRPQKPRKRPGVKSRRHQALRAIVLTEEEFCGVCGLEIDKRLPGTDPMGGTLGHILSVRAFPEFEFDRDNCQAEHLACNIGKAGDHA